MTLMRVMLPLAAWGGWLLACGCSGGGQEGNASAGPEGAPSGGNIVFVDVTEEAGLGDFRTYTGGFGESWAPEINTGSGGWTDYDGDGRPDLMLIPGGVFRTREAFEDSLVDLPAIQLFRNKGDGTFEETTADMGLDEYHTYGYGITAGDYDNDGDDDIFLSSLYENMLFRNDGDRFTEVGVEAGLADHNAWSESTMFFDADMDGFIDLYVVNYIVWSPEGDLVCTINGQKGYCTPQRYPGIRGRYYHNNGDGSFTHRSEEAGFWSGIPEDEDKSLGVASMDYNRDGWPDVMVTNDTERDQLFENQGDGTFEERSIQAGVAYNIHGIPRAGMGIDTGVLDESGEISIVVAHFTDETFGIFRHTGNGVFVDRASASRVGRHTLMTLTFGLALIDIERDGDLDIFTSNGHVQTMIHLALDGVTFAMEPQIFLNKGDGTFDHYEQKTGDLTNKLVGRAIAYADYDRDGDLDVLIVENGGPAHLYRNDTPGGNYFRVKLEGTKHNRSGIDARITISADGRRQERRIKCGSSYLAQHEKVGTFGMADAVTVDTLWVHWGGDTIETFFDIPANQEVYIKEGTGVVEPFNR